MHRVVMSPFYKITLDMGEILLLMRTAIGLPSANESISFLVERSLAPLRFWLLAFVLPR